MIKQCFKCGETKPLAAFYTHPRMADGHLNKCAECTRRDVRERYHLVIDERHQYDKIRTKRPERRAAHLLHGKAHRERHPDKFKARSAVWSAILTGRMKPLPCEVCGSVERVEAHHDDYAKPLDVRWLCFRHHRALHGQRVTSAKPSDLQSPF